MSQIVLVGNGRSLVGRGIGLKIDSYPIVVRFNNFLTQGFESDVGGKTDWWCRNQLDEDWVREESFSKILLRLGGTNFEEFHKGCTEVYPRLQSTYPSVPVEIVPWSVYDELTSLGGEGFNALTGTVALHYLLRSHPQVHVCGFDNMLGGSVSLRHYYSESALVGESLPWHDPDKEQEYLRGLLATGRVVAI